MRIGLDGSFLQPENLHTGMGIYTRGLAEGLLELGHEVRLLGYGARPPGAPDGASWQRLGQLPAGKAASWLSHQSLLPVAAGRSGLDALHITGINVRLSRPGVPFWSPVPLIVTMHDAIPLNYYGRRAAPLPWRLRVGFWLGLQASLKADAIVTVSERAKADLLAHVGLRSEQVTTVLNGIERIWFQREAHCRSEANLPPSPYILYAGSYEHRKNLLGAVDAYRLALRRHPLPPMVLIVERESGHKARVMSAVRQMGIEAHLHFVHSLADEDLVRLYRGAILFFYPSFYEGFGFPPLQAQAAGVPVVASNAASLPEVLGEAALLVDPSSPEEMARALLRVLDHPGLADDLRAAGRRHAAAFTWRRAAEQTAAVYRQVATRRESPGRTR